MPYEVVEPPKDAFQGLDEVAPPEDANYTQPKMLNKYEQRILQLYNNAPKDENGQAEFDTNLKRMAATYRISPNSIDPKLHAIDKKIFNTFLSGSSIAVKLNKIRKMLPNAQIKLSPDQSTLIIDGKPLKVFRSTPQKEYGFKEFYGRGNKPFEKGGPADDITSWDHFKGTFKSMFGNTPDGEKNIHQQHYKLPDSAYQKDKFGNWYVMWKDGQNYYLNSRGVKFQDIAKGSVKTAEIMPTTGATTLVSGPLKKIGIMGLGSAATSAVDDKIGDYFGAKQGVNIVKSAISGTLGAATQGLANVVGKIVGKYKFKKESPLMVDNKLTKEGKIIEKELEKLGMTKEDILNTFKDPISGKPLRAIDLITKGETNTFKLPVTQGQAMQKPSILQKEELIRKGAYGSPGQNVMSAHWNKQDQAIQDGVNQIHRRFQGALNDITGGTKEGLQTGAGMVGQKVKEQANRATQRSTNAFNQVREAKFDLGSFRKFAKSIVDTFKKGTEVDRSGNVVTNINTNITGKGYPGAQTIISRFEDFLKKTAQKKPQKDSSGLVKTDSGLLLPKAHVKKKDLTMVLNEAVKIRQELNLVLRNAQPTDKSRLMMIKNRLDDWLDNASTTALKSGDPNAVRALRKANLYLQNEKQTFGVVKHQSGLTDQSSKAINRIVNDDLTDQEIVNVIYGSSALGKKAETVRIVRRLRGIIGVKSREWATLKQMTFRKIVDNSLDGGKVSRTKLIKNIRDALTGDGRLVSQQIFNKNEMALLKKFAKEISVINPGVFNSSGTASSLMAGLKDQLSDATSRGLKAMGLALGSTGEFTGASVSLILSALKKKGFKGLKYAREAVKGKPKIEDVVPSTLKALPSASVGASR